MACCGTEPARVLATLRISKGQIPQLALDSVHAIAFSILFQVLQTTLLVALGAHPPDIADALVNRIVECADDPACTAAICVILDVDYTRSSRDKAHEEVSTMVTLGNALLLSVL
jgi:hypothetical protein